MSITSSITKLLVSAFLLYTLKLSHALIVMFILTISYQKVIAWIKGYETMTPQDILALQDEEVAIANIVCKLLIHDISL